MNRQEHKIPGLPEPISHYTDVVTYGGLAYLSGFIALDAQGRVVGGDDAAAQTRFVLHQIGAALSAVGSSPEHVLRMNVYLTDIADRASINPPRQEFFGETRPASTLVEVAALVVPQCRVEIEVVAAVPEQGAGIRA
ncbi:MAG: RidA family protein [Nocardioidaceae bacterium]|nr:MAG: RidA family protein [Nocardioidaceae bacterium]